MVHVIITKYNGKISIVAYILLLSQLHKRNKLARINLQHIFQQRISAAVTLQLPASQYLWLYTLMHFII